MTSALTLPCRQSHRFACQDGKNGAGNAARAFLTKFLTRKEGSVLRATGSELGGLQRFSATVFHREHIDMHEFQAQTTKAWMQRLDPEWERTALCLQANYLSHIRKLHITYCNSMNKNYVICLSTGYKLIHAMQMLVAQPRSRSKDLCILESTKTFSS